MNPLIILLKKNKKIKNQGVIYNKFNSATFHRVKKITRKYFLIFIK